MEWVHGGGWWPTADGGGFRVRVGEDLGEGGNFRPLPSETDRIGPLG